MKRLKVGKIYITRKGERVKIVDEKIYQLEEHNSYKGEYLDGRHLSTSTWFLGGKFYAHGKPSDDDLIYEEGQEIDMSKFSQKYVLAFRKSPTEDFRYENFTVKNDLYKKYKKVLKTASFFKVFEKGADGKYIPIYTKQTFVDRLTKEIAKLVAESGKSTEFYLALKKSNSEWAKIMKEG